MYATPNSKINRQEKSKINALTEKLIGKNGIYIGVTATPGRLDLNRTHKNETNGGSIFLHIRITRSRTVLPTVNHQAFISTNLLT